MPLINTMKKYRIAILVLLAAAVEIVYAGPYNDPGIFAYLGEDGRYVHPTSDPNAQVNPIFRGWASGWTDYEPADPVMGQWGYPDKALGPATGDSLDAVSLGDLSRSEIDSGKSPGWVTLRFSDPNDPAWGIGNGAGYDFAVFENGFMSTETTANGTTAGQMFAELGYVEVSSDGEHFARFPSVSLTQGSGSYLTIDITDVFNLAGKHPNSYVSCMGTPFDLDCLRDHPLVTGGLVDLNAIGYVRIVDVPGSGDFFDEAAGGGFADPVSGPDWLPYAANHPIRDSWLTYGSGGFDLDAVGVLEPQEYAADINLDGVVDLNDFVLLSRSWQSRFGQAAYCLRCDLSEPGDLAVTLDDLAIFSEQWMREEAWRFKGAGR